MVYPLVSVCQSVHTSFLDNSSYNFHQITLKLGGQLHLNVLQSILFQGYRTRNIDSHYAFLGL